MIIDERIYVKNLFLETFLSCTSIEQFDNLMRLEKKNIYQEKYKDKFH
jgi:hypothetical protein